MLSFQHQWKQRMNFISQWFLSLSFGYRVSCSLNCRQVCYSDKNDCERLIFLPPSPVMLLWARTTTACLMWCRGSNLGLCAHWPSTLWALLHPQASVTLFDWLVSGCQFTVKSVGQNQVFCLFDGLLEQTTFWMSNNFRTLEWWQGKWEKVFLTWLGNLPLTLKQ